MERFLFNPYDAFTFQNRHAEPLWIFDFFEDNFRPFSLAAKVIRRLGDAPLNDVIAQHHADGLAIGEVLSQPKRIGYTSFTLLIGIVEMFEPKFSPVPKQF